VENSASNGAP